MTEQPVAERAEVVYLAIKRKGEQIVVVAHWLVRARWIQDAKALEADRAAPVGREEAALLVRAAMAQCPCHGACQLNVGLAGPKGEFSSKATHHNTAFPLIYYPGVAAAGPVGTGELRRGLWGFRSPKGLSELFIVGLVQ